MTRRFLAWLLVGLITFASAAWIADHYAAAAIDRVERERLEAHTALLAGWVSALGPTIDAQAAAQDAAQALLARVTLIDQDGVVLGDSSQGRAVVAHLDNHADRPEIAAARSGVTGCSRRRSATTNVVYLYSARRMEHEGPVRYVRIAVRPPANTAFRPSYIALVAGTVALAGTLLAFAYSRHRRLSAAAAAMAQTLDADTATALPEVRDCAEIEPLARSIRRSRARHEARLRAVENDRDVLRRAVDGLQEGLLFVDSSRRVQLANRTARALFEIDFDPIGVPMAQLVRNPALLDALERGLSADFDEVIRLSVDTSERAFDIRVTALAGADPSASRSVLVLLVDVTRLRALERVRQAFVSDVSHELRTPLTAIKAAVETMLDDERFRSEPFAQMILRNADALEGLVDDLTDLSSFESGALTLERSRFDLARLARQTAEQLQPLAAASRIRLNLDEPLWILADERRIRRVLVNLLDNAIKFNRPDGTIEIRGTRAAGRACLSIRDEGIGIPAADLDKIFHRFYQVARDRSRRHPGHGLGLAIVKHLVRLHGGRVSVRSELGQGSTFELDLPLAET